MYRVHYIFSPNKIDTAIDAMEEAAVIWKKHGCLEVSAWRLSGSAIGKMSFTVQKNAEEIKKLVNRNYYFPN